METTLYEDEDFEATERFSPVRYEIGLSHKDRLGMEAGEDLDVCPNYCHHPHHILKAETPPIVGSFTGATGDLPEKTPQELERLADELLESA